MSTTHLCDPHIESPEEYRLKKKKQELRQWAEQKNITADSPEELRLKEEGRNTQNMEAKVMGDLK